MEGSWTGHTMFFTRFGCSLERLQGRVVAFCVVQVPISLFLDMIIRSFFKKFLASPSSPHPKCHRHWGLLHVWGNGGCPVTKTSIFFVKRSSPIWKKQISTLMYPKKIFCEFVTFYEWWNMTLLNVEIVTSNWDTRRSGNESPGKYISRNLTFLEKTNITFKTTCPQDWKDHSNHGCKNGCFPFNYLFERDPYGLLQSQHTFVVYIPYKR